MLTELRNMAWMSLSPLIPVALTTPRFLRWCSDWRWITGSVTPSAAWWVSVFITTSPHNTFMAVGCSCYQTCSKWVPICIYVVQGWFSPGQVFVLDEYCARNGVRGCHRHLCYLRDLLERAENGAIIDPTLLHYSFAFCASHVHGNRCDLTPSLKMFLLCKWQSDCSTGFERTLRWHNIKNSFQTSSSCVILENIPCCISLIRCAGQMGTLNLH